MNDKQVVYRFKNLSKKKWGEFLFNRSEITVKTTEVDGKKHKITLVSTICHLRIDHIFDITAVIRLNDQNIPAKIRMTVDSKSKKGSGEIFFSQPKKVEKKKEPS